MPSPEEIRKQVETLTADLVNLSLCNHQNFPSMRDVGQGICEVGFGTRGDLSYALKNVSYHDIYRELERTQTYNMQMLDGALIQMMYRFRNHQLETHRLAFFPSPFLEEFQNNPDIYLEDAMYAEVIMKNIVPFPLRFDFDGREEVVVEINHPKSHLTLGQYKNCRIPVSAPLMPHHFIRFILRNFYNTAYRKYCQELTHFVHFFNVSMSDQEKHLLYVQIPTQSEKIASPIIKKTTP